jgi:hypothetical protein
MTRPRARAPGIHITSGDGNDDSNYGNDNNECQQQGLGRKRPAFFSLRRVTATMTATTAMTTTNVDDEASGVSARHFYIALHDGNNDSNYGNDDVEFRRRSHRQGLVRKGMTHKPLCASAHATRQTWMPSCASAPGFQPSCASAQATASHIDATIKSTGDIKHRCLKTQIHRQT